MLGILTIATGDKRYINMAKMLAVSLIKNSPGILRAVISDVPEQEFKEFFDIYIPYDPSYGKGLSQKLYLDKYTPFDETIFIDADCLVFNSLDEMINLCRKHSFVVFGGQISSGEWYMDVAKMCERFNLPAIPLFNGGCYYFKEADITTNIYDKARQLMQNYTALGFIKMKNSINEEPLISVAMAINHIGPVDDNGAGMRTPIGLIGTLHIDILTKKCFFNKEGENVQPAILHFAGSFADAFHYKREIAKLKTVNKFPFLNENFISFAVNLTFNMTYALYVFCKRILKVILRREQFDFTNTLPVFSNQ